LKYLFIIINFVLSFCLEAQIDSTQYINDLLIQPKEIDPPSDYYCSGFKINSDFDYKNYDVLNQRIDFEKALQNEISLSEKINLLNKVGFYNCRNHYGLESTKILDSLKSEYIKNIQSNWIWDASITNAYGIYLETPQTCQCRKILSFRSDSLLISQDDSIIYQSKINYTELSSKKDNQVTLKIETSDGLYDYRSNQNFYDIIFDTKLDFLLGIPLELSDRKGFYFLQIIQLGQHQPIEIYSRKIE